MVLDHFAADKLCAVLAEPGKRLVDVVHGKHDAEVAQSVHWGVPVISDHLHLGISALRGTLTVFECRLEAENIAVIVARTRALIARALPWPEIEQRILAQFLRPGGIHFTPEESIDWANKILQDARPPAVRGYLPSEYAVLFHEEGEWNGFPERVWKWQCLPGSHYRKN